MRREKGTGTGAGDVSRVASHRTPPAPVGSGVVIASSGVCAQRMSLGPSTLVADRLAHPPASGRGEGQRAVWKGHGA